MLRAPGSRAPALSNGAPRKKERRTKKTLSTCGVNKACGTEESRLQATIRGGSPRACADAPLLKRVGSPRDRCVRPQSLAPTRFGSPRANRRDLLTRDGAPIMRLYTPGPHGPLRSASRHNTLVTHAAVRSCPRGHPGTKCVLPSRRQTTSFFKTVTPTHWPPWSQVSPALEPPTK